MPDSHECVVGALRKGLSMNCSDCNKANVHTSRDPLLVEREKTHGSFKNTAYAAQEIKNAISKWDVNGIKPEFKEPLEMIAVKIARILAGNCKEKDHWLDIAGYAKLGAEACE